MSLFLVGYMGSGKSSIGKRLANRLEFDFIDMDNELEDYAQAKIEDIFSQSGEDSFRMLENRILNKLIARNDHLVIATGGGVPCHSENMTKITEHGFTLYLDLSPSKVARRIEMSNRKNPGKRPLVKDKSGEELLAYVTDHLIVRKPFYEQADMVVNADKINSAKLDEIKEAYLRWNH